jgi:hypothetical protein
MHARKTQDHQLLNGIDGPVWCVAKNSTAQLLDEQYGPMCQHPTGQQMHQMETNVNTQHNGVPPQLTLLSASSLADASSMTMMNLVLVLLSNLGPSSQAGQLTTAGSETCHHVHSPCPLCCSSSALLGYKQADLCCPDVKQHLSLAQPKTLIVAVIDGMPQARMPSLAPLVICCSCQTAQM